MLCRVPLDASGPALRISFPSQTTEIQLLSFLEVSADFQSVAYIYASDVFVTQVSQGGPTQLTSTGQVYVVFVSCVLLTHACFIAESQFS